MEKIQSYSDFLDLADFSPEWVHELLNLGHEVYTRPHRYDSACAGKILCTLFAEPSTRTRMSFQSAMLRLGGSVMDFGDASINSTTKGETFRDSVKMLSSYADIIVVRHPSDGAALAAAMYSGDCHIINAGDGEHLHPTQTLTDLLTIRETKGRLNNLRIGICGDLLLGRTAHSLCRELALYEGNEFVFIPVEGLEMPQQVINEIKGKVKYSEEKSLPNVIGDLDVLYMTRLQKERLSVQNINHGVKIKINKELMEHAKSDMVLLHPLPRTSEINIDVDKDPRALYFKQAKYGVYIRMALIMTILESETKQRKDKQILKTPCGNPKCITKIDPYLKKYFLMEDDCAVCAYCGH